jgi:hypothetical protein
LSCSIPFVFSRMAISLMPGENNENEEELGGYNQGFCEQVTIV